MAQHHILLCRSLHPAGLALLEERPGIRLTILHDPPVAQFHASLADADAVLCWLERVTQQTLDAAPRLRCVSRYGVGFDTVDIAACTARRVPVMVANGSNDLSVAEHALMLMLAIARRALDTHNAIAEGQWWPQGGPRTVDLAGRRLLVVGYGRIGSRVARYGQALGMKVSVLDPLWRPSRLAADGLEVARGLHAALAVADVVSLNCPLRPDTKHLMDEAAFAAMKPGAILVNTARGPVVKEAALIPALESGRLFGFGTDVLEVEPPEGIHPLTRLKNVVISPHSAASTEEGLARMARAAAQNILDCLDGKPDPGMMVNPELVG
ncbi:NAD(P)-dependent oxidoreductase [Rhodovarius lipocyclicus]|uniref:NAD(P)-dependent oxidoreductase n=1 Tax=Rhodovarius lipocyclicus TaxID=268410 RepID=UPI00135BA402|nr:hydroxyacid dehydrogenase [Rhodovarius lipocyclicus]